MWRICAPGPASYQQPVQRCRSALHILTPSGCRPILQQSCMQTRPRAADEQPDRQGCGDHDRTALFHQPPITIDTATGIATVSVDDPKCRHASRGVASRCFCLVFAYDTTLSSRLTTVSKCRTGTAWMAVVCCTLVGDANDEFDREPVPPRRRCRALDRQCRWCRQAPVCVRFSPDPWFGSPGCAGLYAGRFREFDDVSCITLTASLPPCGFGVPITAAIELSSGSPYNRSMPKVSRSGFCFRVLDWENGQRGIRAGAQDNG